MIRTGPIPGRACATTNARIAALCDVNTAQTERNAQTVLKEYGTTPKVYQDLRKLLEDKEIDAVSIATPNHWHALGDCGDGKGDGLCGDRSTGKGLMTKGY